MPLTVKDEAQGYVARYCLFDSLFVSIRYTALSEGEDFLDFLVRQGQGQYDLLVPDTIMMNEARTAYFIEKYSFGYWVETGPEHILTIKVRMTVDYLDLCDADGEIEQTVNNLLSSMLLSFRFSEP